MQTKTHTQIPAPMGIQILQYLKGILDWSEEALDYSSLELNGAPVEVARTIKTEAGWRRTIKVNLQQIGGKMYTVVFLPSNLSNLRQIIPMTTRELQREGWQLINTPLSRDRIKLRRNFEGKIILYSILKKQDQFLILCRQV